MFYNAYKNIDILVDKFCSELKEPKTIIIHFIERELKALYKETIEIHELKLTLLRDDLKKHHELEAKYNEELTQLTAAINSCKGQIESIKNSISQNNEELNSKKNELELKTQELNRVNEELISTNKALKQKEYDLIINKHNENNTPKGIRIYLTVLLIVSIIAAILIIILIKRT